MAGCFESSSVNFFFVCLFCLDHQECFGSSFRQKIQQPLSALPFLEKAARFCIKMCWAESTVVWKFNNLSSPSFISVFSDLKHAGTVDQ